MQKNTKRFMVWAIVLLLILLIPLTMQFTNEVQWNEAIAYSIILVAVGGIYELWQWLKRQKITYQSALIIGLMTALFIGWVNGAVGIIGSENNSANLLYGTVFIVGLIGSIISRFKPLGMARTLFVAALVQLLIPVFALYIWPAKTSWGEAGVIGVFVINSIFAILFVVSAMLFRRAGKIEN